MVFYEAIVLFSLKTICTFGHEFRTSWFYLLPGRDPGSWIHYLSYQQKSQGFFHCRQETESLGGRFFREGIG
jgi:hypothetical protein